MPGLELASSGETIRSSIFFFIHQNINYSLKEYNMLFIKDY